jgi:hypothetical protein
MNVNPIIISALSPLGLPVDPNVHTGNADEYITFNYADERPALYADDSDVYDETVIQVHYFTKGNPQLNKKAIRKALRGAGFTILSTSEFYESDTGYVHIVVEAWISGVIDD